MKPTRTNVSPLFRLTDFYLAAKIDFITIAFPRGIRTNADALRLGSSIRGRVEVAKRWRDDRDDWITIHDPHRDDLQYLLNNYPEAEILTLEVAVDFFLKDGTNDLERLQAAHRHLTVNLVPAFPQKFHRSPSGVQRKIYKDGKISRDTMKTSSSGMSTYWTDACQWEQVRAYVKTLDNKHPIDRHSARIEVTLDRGGCQTAGVNRVCLLPSFAKKIRSGLSPFFRVAAGIKPTIKRTRTKNQAKIDKAAHEGDRVRRKAKRDYERYGAAAAHKHGNRIIIDHDVSNAIGGALKALREQLTGLQLPLNSAELLERWESDNLASTAILEHQEPPSIEAASTPLLTATI